MRQWGIVAAAALICTVAAHYSQVPLLPRPTLSSRPVCDLSHPSQRQECGYYGIDESGCLSRGCCWSPLKSTTAPWCFRGRRCRGYRVRGPIPLPVAGKWTIRLQLINGDAHSGDECNLYGQDIPELTVRVTWESATRIRVWIGDSNADRYEIPNSQLPRPQISDEMLEAAMAAADYDFMIGQDVASSASAFTFSIIRKADRVAIFDTSVPHRPSLVFEPNYLEISTRVPPNAHVYGYGETVHAFRRDPNSTRQTMWARDAATPLDENIYGSHPFHVEIRDGKAHGVFLRNSNGMDVVLSTGAITYKVVGGVLDFYVFTGPSPADVVGQYQDVVGRPHMIPYWVLGFHQCRYGYKNIDEVRGVVDRFQESRIPLETMWTDIDYMDGFKDFTFDPVNFPEDAVRNFVDELHSRHQRYVLIVDPAIKVERGYSVYDQGVAADIFLKNKDGSLFLGKVWPGLSVFPDFFNPTMQVLWTEWIKGFIDRVPVDGLWIDMNEPASFCDGHCDDNGAVQLVDSEFDGYRINNFGIEAPLQWKTVSPDVLHYNNSRHYDLHNLYGHAEAIMTRRALQATNPRKRPFVLSRSTFSGSGAYAGHWTGDNWSSWDHLYYSIPAMLNFQLFGIPLVGADICGFLEEASEELCARWMELGAFYPFARNHNAIGMPAQEPYLWPTVAEASKRALHIRYTLLPVYYTLFYEAHSRGDMVIRPLIFEFPNCDSILPFIDRQFLLGSSILVSPVMEEGANKVRAFFPGPALWYDWYGHELVFDHRSDSGDWHWLDAPLQFIPLHIRGGTILPLQTPDMTTDDSRRNNFQLLVALDEAGKAVGSLYLDDGETEGLDQFSTTYMKLTVTSGKSGSSLTTDGHFMYKSDGLLERVDILGVSNCPEVVSVDGVQLSRDCWTCDAIRNKLGIQNLTIDWSSSPLSILWQ